MCNLQANMNVEESVAFLESVISNFFTNLGKPVQQPNILAFNVFMAKCAHLKRRHYHTIDYIAVRFTPVIMSTGSSVEFVVNLPLSCIEDIDLMFTSPKLVALPEEFASVEQFIKMICILLFHLKSIPVLCAYLPDGTTK